MNLPFEQLKQWIEQEKSLDNEQAEPAVLSTISKAKTPRSRVVAIRTIEAESILFFTKRGTCKVEELLINPTACIIFI